MKRLQFLLLALGAALLMLTAAQCTSRQPKQAGKTASSEELRVGSPADHLPPYITRMTYFGQRADWSLDGKKILFLEKTFGQAFTVDMETKIIRPVTLNYFNAGYTRAGGKVIGARHTAPNEILGKSSEGRTAHHLSAGDIIVVPHGVPTGTRLFSLPFFTWWSRCAKPSAKDLRSHCQKENSHGKF